MSDDGLGSIPVSAPTEDEAQWLVDELEAVVNEAAAEQDMDPMVISAGLKRFAAEFEKQMLMNHSIVHSPNPFGRTEVVDSGGDRDD